MKSRAHPIDSSVIVQSPPISTSLSVSMVCSYVFDISLSFVTVSDENTCSLPHAYELVRTTYLHTSSIIRHLKRKTVEHCLHRCMSTSDCRSMNYDRSKESCDLLSTDRNDRTAIINSTPNMDYYELACARNNVTSSSSSSNGDDRNSLSTDEPQPSSNVRLDSEVSSSSRQQQNVVAAAIADSKSITTSPTVECQYWQKSFNRVLRQDYRKIHHLNVKSLEECQQLCIAHTTMECRSLSYSSSRNECLLADVGLDQQPIDAITQKNAFSEFYHCSAFVENSSQNVDVPATTTTSTTTTTATKTTTTKTTTTNDDVTELVEKTTTESVALFDPPIDDNDNDEPNPPPFLSTRTASKKSSALNTNRLSNNEGSTSGQKRKQLPHIVGGSGMVGPVSPDSVQVDAECLRDGVNITIRIRNAVSSCCRTMNAFFCRYTPVRSMQPNAFHCVEKR